MSDEVADLNARFDASLRKHLAKVAEFRLTWHPIDGGAPVEIPLGEPWLLPGTDVRVGEFRLSTREVPGWRDDAPDAPARPGGTTGAS